MSECRCCARNCGVDRSRSLGFCGLGETPVVARAALHFGEEPCISGKRGSGTVFFSGCNLRCVFCQNYEISAQNYGIPITVERLREIFAELIAQGAENLNLVTPTHFSEAILSALDEPLPVPVVYNTNGYESVDNIRRFDGKVQIYLPDLKYSDDALAIRYSHAPGYFSAATAAIKEMYRQTGDFQLDEESGMLKRGVIIRHLLLPGQVDNTLRVIDFIANHFTPGQVMFSLMRQYLPCGQAEKFPELNRRVTDAEYEKVVDHLLASGIEDGFLQEADSATSDFIPKFDGTGVVK